MSNQVTDKLIFDSLVTREDRAVAEPFGLEIANHITDLARERGISPMHATQAAIFALAGLSAMLSEGITDPEAGKQAIVASLRHLLKRVVVLDSPMERRSGVHVE